MSRPTAITHAVIPAAGLGTRVRGLTDGPKELLALDGVPVIWASLLEAAHAGLRQVVLVTAPGKPALTDWVLGHSPVPVRVVVQPEPRGVVDAVTRAGLGGRYAVLYPDYVLDRGPGALAALLAAADTRPEATWYGVFEATPARLARVGGSARVPVTPQGPHLALGPPQAEETGWRTTFAEVRTPGHDALLVPGDDGSVGAALTDRAARGLLWGTRLPGEVLDIGVPAGYADAVARFADGRARWASRPEGL
ncbi:MAG: NTP transferase domain-containing protein [Myxococcales bacterium]|nr:NTP transferase domain-containing protein [Myxococcales bacterium]